MPNNSPASQLLARAQTVVVQGDRPVRDRPLRALGAAALVLMGTALALAPDQSEARGRYDRNPQVAADRFDRSDALSVNEVGRGTVIAIQQVTIEPEKGLDARTIGGTVIGGLLGNQVGGGNGRKISIGVGALMGGIMGNRSHRKNNGEPGVEIFIEVPQTSRNGRVHSIETISVVQRAADSTNIQPGDAVFLVQGRDSVRVVPMNGADSSLTRIEAGQVEAEPVSLGARMNARERARFEAEGAAAAEAVRTNGVAQDPSIMSGDFESSGRRPGM